jgi:hypothetical protein
MTRERADQIAAHAWAETLRDLRLTVVNRLIDKTVLAGYPGYGNEDITPDQVAHLTRLWHREEERYEQACAEARRLAKFARPGLSTEDVKKLMKRRGFTHAVSLAGPIPIDEWVPYGNGIEHYYRARLEDEPGWIVDRVDEEANGSTVLYLGRWQFITASDCGGI